MSQQKVDLSYLDTAYRTAEAADQFVKIPDGIYKAKISHAEVKRAQSGDLYIAWRLDVAKSATETLPVQKMNYLSEGYAMSRLKSDVKAIGVDPDIFPPLNRIYEILEYLSGAVVEFEQQTRPNTNNPERPYVNQNFIRLIKASGKEFPVFSEDQMDGFEVLSSDEASKMPWDE